MRRPALYSRSSRAADAPAESPAAPSGADGSPPPSSPVSARGWRRLLPAGPRAMWTAMTLLAVGLVISLGMNLRPGERRLTQEDIDAAVVRTLETTVLPSPATTAVANVAPSVVRVMSFVRNTPERIKARAEREGAREGARKGSPRGSAQARKSGPADTVAEAEKEPEFIENGVGSGVVIVDKGVILTNLHVVSGSDQIRVTFADGMESTASIVGVQPENDLAVLQAHKIPDDLVAATMRSTADLAPGEQVAAVGFPFGIGPSASAGVVSGLKRSFRSPEGKQEMTNLIQFDAAANPGNSGGPLVTMDGEVVGIVTAIYNPTSARTFLGIGFAVPIENAASAVGLHPF